MCLECRYSFTKKNKIKIFFADFLRFYDFILNKFNKKSLLEKTSLSRTSLWRKFKPFFRYYPSSFDSLFLLEKSFKAKSIKHWVLGIDGKWLKRQGVIMIYRDITRKINLYWSYHPSESFYALENDFINLKLIIKESLKNNLPLGVVTDWKKPLVSYVNIFFPYSFHQRCLTHIKRQLTRLLPLKSPILATKDLRVVAQKIISIENKKEKTLWKKEIEKWIKKYGFLLKEKTMGVNTKKKWWYTHGNLRRAIRLLTFDEKYLFAYLNNSFLPKTNNSLEGLNSQIKTKLSNHRGMKVFQQVSFIFWFLTFKRLKNKRDLKQLWDRLKNKIFRF